MSKPTPRIAVLGFSIECNRFAPVTAAEDFGKRGDIRGEQIIQQARVGPCQVTSDLPGFFAEMDAAGPWTPVPLRLMVAQPGGPVEQSFFDGFLREIDRGLAAAGPLDGVYVVSHGAALATGSDDPEGDLYALVRARVGASVPVVATFDLHANVSRRMTDMLDVFVGYLENPHTDIRERGAEAARHLRELLAGGRAVVSMVKLPLVPPSIALLTAVGPYGEMIQLGQTRVGGDIMNVSIMAGFAFSDSPKNGYTAVVTARNGNHRAAFELARELCQRTWAMRERFDRAMTPLPDAVARAVAVGKDPAALPILLADVGDNPGGGGRGNTTQLLQALIAAGAQGVLLGVFNDASLAAEAHALGVGAEFDAMFNRAERDAYSQPFQARAKVLALCDGELIGRRGVLENVKAAMGPSALLEVGGPGGIRIAVISYRQQCMDPRQLEIFGVDIAAARTVVVKSRGHFRAGFDEFFAPERIIEVDCPGLTSPNLRHFNWTRLPRPVYPLDPETSWSPPDYEQSYGSAAPAR